MIRSSSAETSVAHSAGGYAFSTSALEEPTPIPLSVFRIQPVDAVMCSTEGSPCPQFAAISSSSPCDGKAQVPWHNPSAPHSVGTSVLAAGPSKSTTSAAGIPNATCPKDPPHSWAASGPAAAGGLPFSMCAQPDEKARRSPIHPNRVVAFLSAALDIALRFTRPPHIRQSRSPGLTQPEARHPEPSSSLACVTVAVAQRHKADSGDMVLKRRMAGERNLAPNAPFCKTEGICTTGQAALGRTLRAAATVSETSADNALSRPGQPALRQRIWQESSLGPALPARRRPLRH